MSGDVQPRKRKDKKKKKDGADDVQSNFSSEEIMHSHKDVGTGGNMCTKIIFYSLLGALLVMIGIILLDQRGLTDLDSSDGDSQWAPIFQGWLEDPPSHDDDHLKTTDSGEEDHGDDDHEHDSGIEDEDDEHEHEDEEEEEEENEDEHSGGDEEEDENEDEHSGGDEEEDEGLDDDLDEDDEQDIKKDEYSQEIDDSKEEDDEGEEDDDVGNDDDDDVDEEEGEDDDDEGEEDDVGKNDDKDEKEDDEIENFNGDKNQEEDEEGEDEEEQDHDDDDNDDIEDNILFREIPGVVESSEDVEEGNTNGEDLNDSSEDMQDDVKASGEKNDDQVRKMADRSSNINNAAHVVEPHITLQTSDDMKMDLNFKKPVEETKTKESIGVSMEKPHTLSKEPTKQTSRPSKSREKPEDHTQKIDDKIVDSIRPSTGDVTTTDKKPESSYKSSTISPKTSDNTKDKLDTGKASEINIESEKPLRVIDNHKKEQDKRQQNYQKVNENKLHETKVVNNADKQRSDKLNKVSEKPLRTTDTHQKGQDLKQQNYQKVSEETKTASSSSGKKVTETKPVNKAEKQPSDQKIKDDSNTNSVPKKPISNERETSGSKMEDSRIGVNDKSTTEHEKEKQPSDQMKKDDSKTDYVPMKPESNEKEIPSSRTEKYSKIGASDESTTKHKNEKQSTDETKKEDSNSNSLPQKPVSNEKEIPSSKKEKDSIIQTSDKSTVEHQTVDLKSNQKPSLDKTNAGDFSKNHKPVVQTSPEINTKKEGKLTDLEHDKQTHRVSSELNMEKTVKQNPGKVSEQQHNDKLKKEKNEKLNNVIDKSSVYKRDDSQQGKVPSGNDKTVKTEKVKKNVASQAPDKSHQTAKSKLVK